MVGKIDLFWVSAILVFLASCYALISMSLHLGVWRLRRRTAKTTISTLRPGQAPEQDQGPVDLPFVSILVPARDEEENIASCLDSLVRQQYPSDKYEIVVVNDRSTDSTPTMISGYQKEYDTVKSVNIDSNCSGLTGKQNAIKEGLKFCTGEYILNTDADCIVGPLWVRRMVSHFAPKVGIAIGFSTIRRANGSGSLFANLQSLDMLFLMDAAAGAIGVNVPVSCLGRNLACRKAALDDIDYSGMRYTVTEDAALVHTVAKRTDWSATAVYDRDASVLTFAEKKMKQLLSQRIRWVLGGRATRSWSQIPLHVVFLFHLYLVISFPLVLLARPFMFVVLLSILIKATMDFVRCHRVCREFDRTDLLRLFIPYEIFMVLYSTFTGFGSIFVRKVQWKGEVYSRDARP